MRLVESATPYIEVNMDHLISLLWLANEYPNACGMILATLVFVGILIHKWWSGSTSSAAQSPAE